MTEPCDALHAALLESVNHLHEFSDACKLDLLEVCAPWDAPLSQAVRELGGKAMSIGHHNGYDMSTRQGLLAALKLLRQTKPRYVHVSPPCDPWTALPNCHQRTPEPEKDLCIAKAELRKRMLFRIAGKLQTLFRMVGNLIRMGNTCSRRHAASRSGEHPLLAQSWGTPEMKELVRLCGPRFTLHGCRHGLTSKYGDLLLKPWGWFTSHAGVRKALKMRCNHGSHAHPSVQGSLTSVTAIYPRLLRTKNVVFLFFI